MCRLTIRMLILDTTDSRSRCFCHQPPFARLLFWLASSPGWQSLNVKCFSVNNVHHLCIFRRDNVHKDFNKIMLFFHSHIYLLFNTSSITSAMFDTKVVEFYAANHVYTFLWLLCQYCCFCPAHNSLLVPFSQTIKVTFGVIYFFTIIMYVSNMDHFSTWHFLIAIFFLMCDLHLLVPWLI